MTADAKKYYFPPSENNSVHKGLKPHFICNNSAERSSTTYFLRVERNETRLKHLQLPLLLLRVQHRISVFEFDAEILLPVILAAWRRSNVLHIISWLVAVRTWFQGSAAVVVVILYAGAIVANGRVLCGSSRSSCVVGGHTMHHHCLTNDDRMGALCRKNFWRNSSSTVCVSHAPGNQRTKRGDYFLVWLSL